MSAVRWTKGLVPLLACLIWCGVGASPAAAHTELVSSDPAEGGRLTSVPGVVTLAFTDDLAGWGTTVVVTAGDVDVTDGPPTTAGEVVTQAVVAGPPGDWTVSYRVVGEDGHPVQGSFSFAVRAPDAAPAELASLDPAGPDPAGLPADPGDAGALPRPVLAAIAGGGLLLAGGILLRRPRR